MPPILDRKLFYLKNNGTTAINLKNPYRHYTSNPLMDIIEKD